MFEIGNSLREARVRRKLDFRQVEQATKIRGRYLRALEEEDFDALPAETYVRGFLKGYAEFLGLDGQLYVDEYNSRFFTGGDQPAVLRRSKPKRTGRGFETSILLFALTAITVMTALVIAAWKFSSGAGNQAPPKTSPAKTTSHPVRKTEHRHVNRNLARLVVRAQWGNCWLEVHEMQGGGKWRVLYQGTLERNQLQRFVARKLWVNAGTPENLLVLLNGRRVTIGQNRPVVVEITANSITPAQPK